MTKRRAPLTIDAALARIAGQIPGGYDEMALIADRAVRTVRNWGDPDTPEQIPVDCAIRLDLAYQASDGPGAPIFESYAFQLELAASTRFADSYALAKLAPEVIRECGEANAAIVAAAQPGADDRLRQDALREAEEAVQKLKKSMLLISDSMSGAGKPRPP